MCVDRFRRSLIFSLFLVLLAGGCASGPKRIAHQIPHQFGVEDPQFSRSISQLLGPPLLEGNRVTTLINGQQIFPAMLNAISNARKTITFETYIYWSGEVGAQFTETLVRKAREGVKIRMILDWVGSGKIEKKFLEQMKAAGIEVKQYHPLQWWNLKRVNYRTHRKLLIVDGRIGFTGGVGIADVWKGNATSPEEWRDNHYRLEGPAVAQMQAAFMDNWMKTDATVLLGDLYFPALTEAGPHLAQVFRSSPSQGSESVHLMFLLSIASAEKNLRLSAAYFVPDDLTLKHLLEARGRGVNIEIILPGPHIDTKIVRKASKAFWGKLLEEGVRIYEYQPTMYHCKVMIVDEAWVSVGSANFDNRSFRLNDEANLNVLDRDFARQQVDQFEKDKAQSREITFQEWSRRPWNQKLMEKVTTVLRPLL